MSNILIIFPTKFEAKPALKFLRLKPDSTGLAIGKKVSVLISAMASPKAKERVKSVSKKLNPKRIILCGFCGACNPSFELGDVITEHSLDTDSLNLLRAKTGKIYSANAIASQSQKKRLFEVENFDAVEMEYLLFSEALKEIEWNGMLEHIRVVSDTVKSKMPTEFFSIMTNSQTGEMDAGIIVALKYIFQNPSVIFKLISFGIEAGKANKAYEKFLLKYLKILTR